ncbi:MAG TPA: response regulator transcription factor [Methylocella sp.]|nr:response regulator transcription factor [Methylocella sp.]
MRVLIVDDHPMVIAGCRGILASQLYIEVIEAHDAREALDAHASAAPDVTVLDINLPDVSGLEVLREILRQEPKSRIIVFTMNEDPALAARAIELGAMGYIAKSEDPSHLVNAVRLVAGGSCYLSDQIAQKLAFFQLKQRSDPFLGLSAREIETLHLLAEGKGMAEIAHAMKISYKTAANCCSLLKHKLGARSRADLIRIAVEGKASKMIV